MGDEKHTNALGIGQLAQKAQRKLLCDEVEPGGRLIGYDKSRIEQKNSD
jgi:hypothetical protein